MSDEEAIFDAALRVAREFYELVLNGLTREAALRRLADNEARMLEAFRAQEERLKRGRDTP